MPFTLLRDVLKVDGAVVPIWRCTGSQPYADRAIREMLFVKKRAYGEITIGGLTVTNLAMFEDVNFPEHLGLEASTQHHYPR
jgi:hypothetical protein